MTVVFFDVSTRLTGVAYGPAVKDAVPTTLVWDHGGEAGVYRRLGRLLTSASALLKEIRPSAAGIEAPMQAFPDAPVSQATLRALTGGAMLVGAVCDLRGVHDVRITDVQEIRAHFLDKRTFPRATTPSRAARSALAIWRKRP